MTARHRLAIFISGRGSNMEAIVQAKSRLNCDIVGVVSSRANVEGVGKARTMGIPVMVFRSRDYSSPEVCYEALQKQLETWGVTFIALAGFMRILSDEFVTRWENRIVNIHPSLLPLFPGINPYKQALEAGVTITGCTVHYVTVGPVDGGPIIAQSPVSVLPGDDEVSLAARILWEEHWLYPNTLQRIFDIKGTS